MHGSYTSCVHSRAPGPRPCTLAFVRRRPRRASKFASNAMPPARDDAPPAEERARATKAAATMRTIYDVILPGTHDSGAYQVPLKR